MNSVEGYKGFITFLILSTIIGISLVGFNKLNQPTSTISVASPANPEPINLYATLKSNTEVEINWITKDPTIGKVIYSKGTWACHGVSEPTDICRNILEASENTVHKISLVNLDEGTEYFYKVEIDRARFPAESALSFITSSKPDTISNQPTLSNPADSDSDGIIPIPSGNTNTSNEILKKEFKDATIFNNQRYDFNKDGEVTQTDWPLFLEWINNPED